MSLTADELGKKTKLVSEFDSIKKQINNNYISDVLANSGFTDYTTRLFQPVITSLTEQISKLDKLQEDRMRNLRITNN